ncbi:hypothetical protein BDV37DRAFT_279680 [Aspergillus pseudonomiae]|uniref:Uncharacterized protein n=1 Tax=Aspergillus pseudonomiae TaxID=1506151 RepID=A0A5N7DPF5_9EURO|nr:uncharacterized protein BDV37DRAFT_279680 [Aspergillus pseudonomiae]KAE8407899.1 hypothetical protein BDV37DRAFT_279680 [Aspergillus pseudonomiae]
MEQASNNPVSISTPASVAMFPRLDDDDDFPTIYDAWRPYISPCKETDELFSKHSAVIKAIMGRLDTAGFISVGSYRVSDNESRQNSRPTVMIAVERERQRNWSPVVEQVKRILVEFELPTVHVLIYKEPTEGSCST